LKETLSRKLKDKIKVYFFHFIKVKIFRPNIPISFYLAFVLDDKSIEKLEGGRVFYSLRVSFPDFL